MGYELSVAKGYEHTTVTATSMTLLIVKTGRSWAHGLLMKQCAAAYWILPFAGSRTDLKEQYQRYWFKSRVS